MIFIIVEIIFVLVVAVVIAREEKQKKEKKLANAFVWFCGLLLAFSIYYFVWQFKLVSEMPKWSPFDFLVIAAVCYLAGSSVEFLSSRKKS